MYEVLLKNYRMENHMSHILTSIDILSCITLCTLSFSFMNRVFMKSFTGSYVKYYVVLTVFMFCVNLFQNNYLSLLSTFLFFFLLARYLYYSETKNINLYTISFMCFLIATEIILDEFLNILRSFLAITETEKHVFVVLVALIVDLIMYRIFIKRISENSKVDVRLYKLELSLLVISLMVLIELCLLGSYQLLLLDKISVFIVCIVIIGFDVVFVLALEKNEKEKYESKELDVSEIMTYYNHYNFKEEREHYLQQRKLIHDIKDHLLVLESFYIKDEKEKAVDYQKLILEKLDDRPFFSKDPILQVLLNKTQKKCAENNIDFLYKEKIDQELEAISDFDKVTIFSNLLRNAYEASILSSLDEKYITIDVTTVKSAFVICARNSFNSEVNKKQSNFLSTKKNHSGIGIDNITKTVQRLGGMVNIDSQNDEFEIMIYIPLEIFRG